MDNKTNSSYPIYYLTGKRHFSLGSKEVEPLNKNYIRVSFRYCAICGSDISTFNERRNPNYPLSMGHEFVGVVKKIGTNITNFKVGEFVSSDLNYRCNDCEYCLDGMSHLCVMGQNGYFTNRAFSKYADIHHSYLIKLKSSKPFMTLTEPLSCLIHAFNKLSPQKTKKILVIGVGGIGTCLAFLLTCRKYNYDVMDVNEDRLKKISLVLNKNEKFNEDNLYDYVFDTSGSIEGLKEACLKTKKGGHLLCMSHLDGQGNINFLYKTFLRKDITFYQSYLNGNKENLLRF